MLRYGVSRDKLPLEILESEIDSLVSTGVALETGMEIGGDRGIGELESSFDAVVLTPGEIGPRETSRFGVATQEKGISVERKSYMTSRKGVFAGTVSVTLSSTDSHVPLL